MDEQTKIGNRLDHFEKEDLDRKLVEEGSFTDAAPAQAELPLEPQPVFEKPAVKPEDMDDFEKEDLETKLVAEASFVEVSVPAMPSSDEVKV